MNSPKRISSARECHEVESGGAVLWLAPRAYLSSKVPMCISVGAILAGGKNCCNIVILRYRQGPDIDLHDAIWRLDNAPVEGYEDYVSRDVVFFCELSMSMNDAGDCREG